jgi:hypothetical protein
MAEGRMLKNKISIDVKVADLADDAHRICFTWGISHLDIAGRISGDPREFKAKVIPMLDHITRDKVLDFFEDAVNLGLIERYQADGKWVVQYPGFGKNQSLRDNKEAPSCYPPPPDSWSKQEEVPDDSGSSPGVVLDKGWTTPLEGKGREEKRRERKGRATPPQKAAPANPIFSCESFTIDQAYLDDLCSEFKAFPADYLLSEFFPRMKAWCLDNYKAAKHRKKFDGLWLKNPHTCFQKWLKTEDPGKAASYRPRKSQPALPKDPPGMQTVWNPDCPVCEGSGYDRDGPCQCGKLEPIVDPDPKCPKCGGRGMTKAGLCDCFKPRGPYAEPTAKTATAPAGQA